MTPTKILPIGLLLSLLVACGQTQTPTVQTSPAQSPAASASTQTADTWTPSADQQAQLATLQDGLSRENAAGNVRPSFHAQGLDCPTQAVAPYDASKLSEGMYWYAPGNSAAPGGVGCRAREDGGAIAGYYDPSKPVMIFVHGWQPDYVKDNMVAGTSMNTGRYNFWFPAGNINVADAWIKAGWNVGMYQWTQLADDESDYFMPFNSQAKIWTTNYAMNDWGKTKTIGMRYMTPSGYSYQNMPTVPAGELFYRAYKQALSAYANPEPVRVVGHSLGAQMALAMADLAYRDPSLHASEKPARIALVDPYWSPSLPVPGHNYAYLAPDANPAAHSARIAASLIKQGAVIDWVKSSPLLDIGGDNNQALLNLVTRTQVDLAYIPVDLSAKHNGGGRWYLLTQGTQTGATTAANTQAQARALMAQHAKYVQSAGQYSSAVNDDTFRISPF